MSRQDLMRQAALEAAQRRRRLALWLEHFERLHATQARTPEQQQLKEIAIAMHFEQRPVSDPFLLSKKADL